MTRVKVCGITRLEDAQLAAKLGAWAVGFVFTKNSPRYIESDKAEKMISLLPENLEKIGVFVNQELEEIENIALKTGLTQIQLHGEESKEFCFEVTNKIKLSLIKAIRIKDKTDLSTISAYKNVVSAILLDAYSKDQYGGTGKTFDWDIAVKAKDYGAPVILAGGINFSNIVAACQKIQPYALDVSSGVEREKGIKDHNKLEELFSVINTI